MVYTFVPAWDWVGNIDMLGSTYDTKIYVYDENLSLIACNDDFYPDYVSCIQDIDFVGGVRYYLVIDGYGGDCGEYVVSFCEHLPCVTECLSSDLLEDEPPLVEGYVDTYNGGCDAATPEFQFLELPPGSDVLHFCGTSGYAGEGDQQVHDTDWLQLVAMGDEVRIEFSSPYGFPVRLDVLFLEDCENLSLLPYELGTCAVMDDITVPTTPGQLVTLRVAPLYDTRPGCSWADIDQYRLDITGLAGPVMTESRTWSEIKALYE